MTSPLGHHTIGHTIIIFCTNDRLWLGVGPVFRQTLNCTNRISSYHKEVFFSWATMHQFNVIFEVPVNSFARHAVIAQASPKIPQHQMAVPEGLLRPAFSLFCRSVWKSTAGIRTCKTRERNLCSWMASGSRKCLKFYELELVNFFL